MAIKSQRSKMEQAGGELLTRLPLVQPFRYAHHSTFEKPDQLRAMGKTLLPTPKSTAANDIAGLAEGTNAKSNGPSHKNCMVSYHCHWHNAFHRYRRYRHEWDAEILLNSDIRSRKRYVDNANVRRLRKKTFLLLQDKAPKTSRNCVLIIISTAIKPDNPGWLLLAKFIPIVLSRNARRINATTLVIAVTGTQESPATAQCSSSK